MINKSIIILIINIILSVYADHCEVYAPPMVYGSWTQCGTSLMMKSCVAMSITYDAMGDTQVMCEQQCGGGTISSGWCIYDKPIIGYDSVHCKGIPTGSGVGVDVEYHLFDDEFLGVKCKPSNNFTRNDMVMFVSNPHFTVSGDTITKLDNEGYALVGTEDLTSPKIYSYKIEILKSISFSIGVGIEKAIIDSSNDVHKIGWIYWLHTGDIWRGERDVKNPNLNKDTRLAHYAKATSNTIITVTIDMKGSQMTFTTDSQNPMTIPLTYSQPQFWTKSIPPRLNIYITNAGDTIKITY